MPEEIPTYYCSRIQSRVMAEKTDDLTGRVIVACKYYNMNPHPLCFINFLENKRCLVKLTMQREQREIKKENKLI